MASHLQFIFHWQYLSRWHISVGVIAMAHSIIAKAANSQISFTHISRISHGGKKVVYSRWYLVRVIKTTWCKWVWMQQAFPHYYSGEDIDRLERILKADLEGLIYESKLKELGTSCTVWLNDGSGPNWIKWHSLCNCSRASLRGQQSMHKGKRKTKQKLVNIWAVQKNEDEE